MARRNNRRDNRDDDSVAIIPATKDMDFDGQVATPAEDISRDGDGSFVRFRIVRKARSRNGYEDQLWNTVVVSYPYAQGVLDTLTEENATKFRVNGRGSLELNVFENRDGDEVSEYQIRAVSIGASFIFGAAYDPPEKPRRDDDEDEEDRRNSRKGRRKSRRDDDEDEDEDGDEDEDEERPRGRKSGSRNSARRPSRKSSDENEDEDEDDFLEDEEEEERPTRRRSSRRTSRSRGKRVESHGDSEDEELD